MIRITICLLAGMLSWPALAQDPALPADEQAEEIRRYTVEVIIFSYAEDVSVGTEIFVPEVPQIVAALPDDGEEIVFDDTTMTEVVPEEPGQSGELMAAEFEIVRLEQEDFTLTDAMERLERLDAYRPLMHFGWTQPTRPDEETASIALNRFDQPPPGLKGELTLYLGRYLHFVVDLTLDDRSAPDASQYPAQPEYAFEDGAYRFGDTASFVDEPVEAISGRIRFRINEDRIIKNGEIRYYDHPKFGVIARVTRVEEDETEDTGEVPDPLVGRRLQ